MFKLYDLVHIKKKLSNEMSHFVCDEDAIVVEFSSGGNQYCLFIKGHGKTSWYSNSDLEFIKHDQIELLKKWKEELEEEHIQKGDIDWIFKNCKEVLKNPHGSTISTLAKYLGCTNLWGSHGEGFVYYQNAMTVLSIAKPFLEKEDKAGWIEFAKKFVANK